MKRETRLKTTALSREIKELTKIINDLVRRRAELRHEHRRLLDSDKEHFIKVNTRRLSDLKSNVLNNTSSSGIYSDDWRLKEISKLETLIADAKAGLAIEEALNGR